MHLCLIKNWGWWRSLVQGSLFLELKHWVPLSLIRPVLLRSKRREYIRNSKKRGCLRSLGGHWEVIGIGEPIFDQKLRPIVAEEVIKILFPCFWSDAINSCENPKSKKYKKNLKSWDILPLPQSAVDWSQLLTFSAACVALQHMQLCVPSILSWTSGKPEVPCFLMIAELAII